MDAAIEWSTSMKDAEFSKKKPGAPKGNKNALNNRGGAKKSNRNAIGNSGGSVPMRNGNAVSHGLYRKYLPQELYDLKEELEEAINNDPLSILWESVMLQHAQIIHAQRIMFVRNKEDMTKELRKKRLTESGFEEEWEIQFAWDKQASFLTAQSKALSTLPALIRDFDRLANIDDERRAKLEFIQVQIDKIKSTTNNDDNNIEPVVIVDNISDDLNV